MRIVGIPTLLTQCAYLTSKFVLRRALTSIRLLNLYGPSGFLLYYFGSLTTWRVEAQVLGRLDDDDAMGFKKSVQDEGTMVSVAVRLVLHCLSKGPLLI